MKNCGLSKIDVKYKTADRRVAVAMMGVNAVEIGQDGLFR